MAKPKSPISIRSAVFFLMLVGLTLLVVTRFASFNSLIARLQQGVLIWLIAAVMIHILFFYLNSVMYHYSFRTVEIDIPAIALMPVLFTSLFVNAVVPAGGAGGGAIFVDYAAQQGYPGSRAAVGVLLALISDLFTLNPFILAGIFFLLSQGHLEYYEWLAFLFYFIFTGGLAGILYIGYKKPDWIHVLFSKIRGGINKIGKVFKKPELIKETWIKSNAQQFIDGSHLIVKHPKILLTGLMWAVVMHVVNMFGLYMFFRAYNQTVDFGTINAAFSLGIVFYVVAIIPQGVGAEEGIMSLILIAMGMNKTNAIVIAVAYRGVNFWFPLLVGFISYHFVTSKFIRGERPQRDEEDKGNKAVLKEPDAATQPLDDPEYKEPTARGK